MLTVSFEEGVRAPPHKMQYSEYDTKLHLKGEATGLESVEYPYIAGSLCPRLVVPLDQIELLKNYLYEEQLLEAIIVYKGLLLLANYWC